MPSKHFSRIYEYKDYIIRGLACRRDNMEMDIIKLTPYVAGIGYPSFLSDHAASRQTYLVFVDILDDKGNIAYTKCLAQADYSEVAYGCIHNFIDHFVHPELETCIKEFKFED